MNPSSGMSGTTTESVAREYCNSASEPESSGYFSHFNVRKVAEKIAKRFPVSEITGHIPKSTFWFTNEYPEGMRGCELSLAKTITKLRESSFPVKERRVSIITGESGLLSSIPELSCISELIIQVDSNPLLLNFTAELLKQLSNVTSFNPKKYHQIILSSLECLKRKGFPSDAYVSEVMDYAKAYKKAMRDLHCFSSQRRFEAFKSALNKCYIQAIEANYFSKKDMVSLFEILAEEGFEVSYFNISNVCEYLFDFYDMNPYDGLVKDMESTAHIRAMPLAEDAVCAYSSLLSTHDHTGTCTKDLFFDRLHQINKSMVLRMIEKLSATDKPDIDSITSACVALAKIDRTDVKSSMSFLRLLLAHITDEESTALLSKVAEIEHILSKNKMYDSESGNKFMDVIKMATKKEQPYI
ncbi:hypothetical protein [Endozoicomonas sp. 4G]|uniref:hypothetical protein n=1 Tax=Endozoicomonas sp. 4G TaxID=2872754 RepID=UPI0020788E7E|nr:hypothetical protein [Endozoicomonas sp. 4G]